MRSIRRAIAGWSLFLLLQPSLLAGVVGCGALQAGESDPVNSRAAHAMASMAGDDSMPMDMGANASTDGSAPSERSETDGFGGDCSGARMPSDCAAMGGCGLPPLVLVALVQLWGRAVVVAHTPAPLAMPTGIAKAPETPPPRA